MYMYNAFLEHCANSIHIIVCIKFHKGNKNTWQDRWHNMCPSTQIALHQTDSLQKIKIRIFTVQAQNVPLMQFYNSMQYAVY